MSVSGGHLNPAITIAFFAAGKLPGLRALLYITFQCLGSCTGSAIVLAVRRLPHPRHSACA